jgi:hypothetical protein
MAKEELKWQNIDADDLPSAVKVDLIRHWRQGGQQNCIPFAGVRSSLYLALTSRQLLGD